MTMGVLTDSRQAATDGELEFFGFQLRVRSPRLAALLAADEDCVQVGRAGETVAPALEERPAVREAEAIWRNADRETDGIVVQLRRPSRNA
jgi:hypothetical protein